MIRIFNFESTLPCLFLSTSRKVLQSGYLTNRLCELDFLKRNCRSLIVNKFRLKLTCYYTLKICLSKLVDQKRNERLCRTINGLRESLSSEEITDPRLSLDPLLVDEVRLFVFCCLKSLLCFTC